jgi:type IX secretion system PorP/SprF family membrane protein
VKLNFYIIFILCLVSLTVKAQYDVSFAHYWTMEPSFNPAAVGKESKLNIAGAYAIQMAGFEHNPNTMYAAADMPFYALRSYHGVGIQFMNDAIGLFTHKRFGLQYAYQPKLWGGRLSMGLQVSMLSENFDGSKAEVIDPDDPAITSSSVNGSAFDIGLGLYYRRHNWYAGFSVLHVTSPRVELGDKNQLDIAATYYLTGGYNIQLRNPLLSMHPSVLARYDGAVYRVDVTARLKYEHEKKRMYAGLAYSPGNSVTALIGGNFHGISVGYSYEAYTNSAIGLGKGSHELFVGYQTTLDFGKKGRNRHQSVRIL